jgi:hypothetical protein
MHRTRKTVRAWILNIVLVAVLVAIIRASPLNPDADTWRTAGLLAWPGLVLVESVQVARLVRARSRRLGLLAHASFGLGCLAILAARWQGMLPVAVAYAAGGILLMVIALLFAVWQLRAARHEFY